jgi:hypothetical protein
MVTKKNIKQSKKEKKIAKTKKIAQEIIEQYGNVFKKLAYE